MAIVESGRPLSRRRVISILAASAVLPLAAPLVADAALVEPYRWQGIVLGATADLTLYAGDHGQAATIVGRCLDEIARLEHIFSVHQPDSALSRLNRDGQLTDPPFELVELLSRSLILSELSRGRFDPTIQPLWKLIADHFAAPNPDSAGPNPASLALAQALVNHRAVRLTADLIAFALPGMQVTLNGIAQGYISDQIGELLKAQGFTHALVNLGETLAIDRRSDGKAWRIAIPAPGDRSRFVEEIDLQAGAVATSAARGLLFDATGRFNHIIDPTVLICADPDRSVTVLADSATVADGLSTLGALVPDPARDLRSHLERVGARAFIISGTGEKGMWLS